MNRQDFAQLEAYQGYPAISIIAKTHRTVPDRLKDQILVKNLVKEVHEKLLAEFPLRQVKPLLDKLDELVSNIDFSKTLDTLALFVSDTIAKSFILPGSVESVAIVDPAFYLKPILRNLQRSMRYWVLSVNEKPARLFEGISSDLVEIIEPEVNDLGVPQDGFPYEYIMPVKETTPDLRGNTHMDHFKKEYFRRVDHLLAKFMAKESLPLVLVGEERNIAFFKEVSNNLQRVIAIIHESVNTKPTEDVAKYVWPIVDAYFREKQLQKIDDFKQALNNLKHAFGLMEVWRVTMEGRVHELLVETGYAVPGKINPENPHNLLIYSEPGIGVFDDLIDEVISAVIKHGGAIVFVPKDSLKEYERIAALLRY